MFRFGPGADNRHGNIGNDGVCRGPDGDRKCCAPIGSVQYRRLDDPDEVECSRFVLRDLKEEQVEDLPEHGEVIVGWLAYDRLK